jgi:hypothetical protein
MEIISDNMVEKRNAYMVLVGRHKGNRQLGNNIKWWA